MARKLNWGDDSASRRVGVIARHAGPDRPVPKEPEPARGDHVWGVVLRQMGGDWGVAFVRHGHEFPIYGPREDLHEALVAVFCLCWITDSRRFLAIVQEYGPQEFLRYVRDNDFDDVGRTVVTHDVENREHVIVVNLLDGATDGGQDPDTVIEVFRMLDAIPRRWHSRRGRNEGS